MARQLMNLGPSPRYVVTLLIILNLQTAMVSTKIHISHYDLFKTFFSASINPPTYSNWKALTDLSKHQQPFRRPSDTSPERANIPKSFVTQEVKNPTTDDREEEVLPI